MTRAEIEQIAREAAAQYGLPADVFLRLIQQESGFDPSAVSPKGAIGPAQLMPDTAAEECNYSKGYRDIHVNRCLF